MTARKSRWANAALASSVFWFGSSRKKHPFRTRLLLELLEDRCVPTTITPTTFGDPDPVLGSRLPREPASGPAACCPSKARTNPEEASDVGNAKAENNLAVILRNRERAAANQVFSRAGVDAPSGLEVSVDPFVVETNAGSGAAAHGRPR